LPPIFVSDNAVTLVTGDKRAIVLKTILSRLHRLSRRISAVRLLLSLGLGALTLVLINTVPAVEHSFVGAPDRAMQDTAFWLRADNVDGDADPVLFVDIDDETVALPAYRSEVAGFVPSVYVSRTLLADLLRFALAAPAAEAPRVVMVDADIGGPAPDPAGEEKLKRLLADWAASPTAPMLVLARETFEPAPFGQQGALRMLRTPYDDIVGKARNIRWGTSKVLFDADGVVQEASPYDCIAGPRGGVTPLFSMSVLAYEALNGGLPVGSPAAKAVAGAADYCKTLIVDAHGVPEPPRRPAFGLTINYHLSMRAAEQGYVWPPVGETWRGRKACGQAAVLRTLSASIIAQAGPDASHDILCQRVMLIGGTNQIANDIAATPLGAMPGALVLANATRGLQLSNGGLRAARWAVQFGVLVVVTLAMFFASGLIEDLREGYQARRRDDLKRRILMLPLNPVIFSGLMWAVAYAVGVVLLLWSMSLGYWGFLSGPAMGSAIGNLLGDFIDEEKS
jgi:hypothetical protein